MMPRAYYIIFRINNNMQSPPRVMQAAACHASIGLQPLAADYYYSLSNDFTVRCVSCKGAYSFIFRYSSFVGGVPFRYVMMDDILGSTLQTSDGSTIRNKIYNHYFRDLLHGACAATCFYFVRLSSRRLVER